MRVISEGPTKITKTTIDATWRRRRSGHRLVIRDRDCRGLALIVNATTMIWSYAYRPRGTDPDTGRRWPNRTVTLGNPSTHSADAARMETNRIKGQAATGADPAAEKKARAIAEQRARGATLGKLVDRYAVVLPNRPKMRGPGVLSAKYVAEELIQVRIALAEMKAVALPAAHLTDRDVRGMLSGAVGLTTARHRFGPLDRFLDWCQDEGYIKINPCMLIARARRPRAPQARGHYLTPAALARLWTAAGVLREPVWRDLARFMIAVPCRRGEAARLDWAHVDLDAAEWQQPGYMTKNGDPHRLHLNALALDVLRARLIATGGRGLIFPAPKSGGVIDTFSAIKAALIDATKPQAVGDGATLTGWTWHDFRRSFATALGEARVPEPIADAILNHRQSATRGGVMGVYQRASRWPEQRDAMELWGRLLAAAIGGKPKGGVVVPFVPRAG